ncbi:hypothetical protein GJ496_009134 [Pomphorhynchus laevis]|nr:hypothetical protein GJ496_009134 [Pomphorhynchus laevis]
MILTSTQSTVGSSDLPDYSNATKTPTASTSQCISTRAWCSICGRYCLYSERSSLKTRSFARLRLGRCRLHDTSTEHPDFNDDIRSESAEFGYALSTEPSSHKRWTANFYPALYKLLIKEAKTKMSNTAACCLHMAQFFFEAIPITSTDAIYICI